MNFWCYDNHSWKSEGSSHNITANLMNTSPPVFQPVHPALLWPSQKSVGKICKQSCHPNWWGAATGPLKAGWVTGDMVFLFTEPWHYSPAQRQHSRVWARHWHIQTEMMVEICDSTANSPDWSSLHARARSAKKMIKSWLQWLNKTRSSLLF